MCANHTSLDVQFRPLRKTIRSLLLACTVLTSAIYDTLTFCTSQLSSDNQLTLTIEFACMRLQRYYCELWHEITSMLGTATTGLNKFTLQQYSFRRPMETGFAIPSPPRSAPFRTTTSDSQRMFWAPSVSPSTRACSPNCLFAETSMCGSDVSTVTTIQSVARLTAMDMRVSLPMHRLSTELFSGCRCLFSGSIHHHQRICLSSLRFPLPLLASHRFSYLLKMFVVHKHATPVVATYTLQTRSSSQRWLHSPLVATFTSGALTGSTISVWCCSPEDKPL